MIRLIIARHGETVWNRHGLLQGGTDIPLSERGRQEADALSGALRAESIDAVYSSPLRRAHETARAVAEPRRLPVGTLPDLRELSYGLWQGRGAAWRHRAAPELESGWRTRPWTVRFPGGESLAEASVRACRVLRYVEAEYVQGTVLLVAHGHLNRLLWLEALRLDREGFGAIERQNGATRTLTMIDGVWREERGRFTP